MYRCLGRKYSVTTNNIYNYLQLSGQQRDPFRLQVGVLGRGQDIRAGVRVGLLLHGLHLQAAAPEGHQASGLTIRH